MTTSTGISSLLWFIAVLAMIPLVLWLLKRSPLGGQLAGPGGAGAMRTVSMLSLAPGQRVVTVEVGHGAERRWLVLGVCPQQITTLHTMLPQEGEGPLDGTAPGASGPTTPFARLLGGLRKEPK